MLLTDEKEEYLTTEEAAEKLRIHPETLRELLRQGKLPGRRVGRQWRISERALEAFMQEGEGESPGTRP